MQGCTPVHPKSQLIVYEWTADGIRMNGCTKVQPYRLLNSNQVRRTVTRKRGNYDGSLLKNAALIFQPQMTRMTQIFFFFSFYLLICKINNPRYPRHLRLKNGGREFRISILFDYK